MEARCYVGGASTRLTQLHMQRLDWLALAAVAAYTAFMLLYQFPL